MRLKDRFGDYGIISVVIAVPMDDEPDTLRIDTWLMSCRAIGRTVEHQLMNCVVERACELGYRSIVGEYIATAKNEQVATFYPECGYQQIVDSTEYTARRFRLAVEDFVRRRSSVDIMSVDTAQPSFS